MDLPAGNYLASSYGVSPSTTDNTPAWNALVALVRASVRGGRIWLEPGPYNFASATVDPGGSPIEFMGSGTNLTYLQADGGLIASGDLFTPKRQWRMFGLTIGATSVRAAGSLVKVTGDMLIATVPAKTLTNWEFGDVCLQNGFDGVTLVDGAGPLGVAGFFWDGGFSIAHGFAAGGTVFQINTPNGVVNSFANVTHSETSGVADGSRPAATMHISGCADFRMSSIESVYAKRGLVVDPGSGITTATIFASKCIWGQTTQEAVLLNPNSGATCHTIEMTGGYVDTGGMYVGAYVRGLYAANMSFLGNTPNDAIRLDGTVATSVFENLMFTGVNAKCFHALNNARNFRLTGGFSNTAGNNTVGVHIEAGCDKYIINTVGSEFCTTPLTEPSPGASRSVTMF